MRFFYFLLASIFLAIRLVVLASPWLFFNTEIGHGPDVIAATLDSFLTEVMWCAISIPILFFREFRSAGLPLFALFGSAAYAGYGRRANDEHDPAHPFHYVTPGTMGYMAMHDD